MADGKIAPIGSLLMKDPATGQDIPLSGIKDTPKRALINYNHDILSE
jgi:hypothetical protein